MEGKLDNNVLIVAGPTASGKSALALALATEFDGVVINADSMQVYAELRILTARPSPRAEALVPHRLYGVLPVTEPCSAARWRELAVAEITAAQRAGRLAVICGGTGLYLRALTEGLSPIPEIPDAIRRDVRARLSRDGSATLHAALAERDPVTATRLAPGDGQRVSRALEVFEATGRPLAEWQNVPPEGPPPGLRFATILLTPPREALYAACDARLIEMVRAGALEEVEALRQDGVDPALPAMRSLGMPAFLRHQAGELGLEEAIEIAQQATRRYAKRQMTWFNNQIIPNYVVNTQYSEKILPVIFSFIRQNILTTGN